MGFFSSIGSVLGGAVGSIFGPVGTVVGAGLGSALGGSGSSTADRRYDQQMSLSQQQMQFQQDYVKNAMQWRAEDAKKAGFHPMAALGFSSPQYSGVSFPSIPGDTQSIDPMEFGQSLNYAATKAKDAKQQEAMIGLQMRGMELDNEYKQAQIDAIKVDTLASTIASNQAFSSPSAPEVNASEPTSKFPSNKSFSDGTAPLLGLSRVGNTLISHINPDISDALTEDMIRNILANATAEMQSGRLSPEVAEHFSKDEIDAIRRGDAEIVYQFPSRWTFLWKPHMRPKYSDDRRSVSGKIIRGRL